MRAVVIEKPRTVQVKEVLKPSPKEGEVIIRVSACGVCGTDVHIYKGEYLGDYPVVPGHEFAGEVIQVGSAVTEFSIGDRVAVEPNLSCGHCRFCRLNEQNFCESWKAIGVGLPGAMAEYVAAPASAVFDIGNLSFETAALMEPLSCVLHGMKKVAVRHDESVLVIGAGPIGLLIAQVARDAGAARIVMVDRVASRLELAQQLVADESINTSEGFEAVQQSFPGGADVVIDATGVPAVIEKTVELVRLGGRILWFGVAANDAVARIKPFDVFRKGLSIYASYTSLRNSREALQLLGSGTVKVNRLISHRLTLEDFERAVKLLEDPEDAMKILLLPLLCS